MFLHSRPRGISRFAVISLVSLLAVGLFAMLAKSHQNGRMQGRATGCKSNLKNIGTALEMYQADHGTYPQYLSGLTPNYLRAMPSCPGGFKDTYSGRYYSTEILPAQDKWVHCEAAHQGPDKLRECESRLAELNGMVKTALETAQVKEAPSEPPVEVGSCPTGSKYAYRTHVRGKYLAVCGGENHPGLHPPDYPRYTAEQGLVEQPL